MGKKVCTLVETKAQSLACTTLVKNLMKLGAPDLELERVPEPARRPGLKKSSHKISQILILPGPKSWPSP